MSRTTTSKHALTPTSLLDEVMDIFARPQGGLVAASWTASSTLAGLARHDEAHRRLTDKRDAA